MHSSARRPMSAALRTADPLTPEAMAFIKEGTPKSKTERPVLASAPLNEEPQFAASVAEPPSLESSKTSQSRVSEDREEAPALVAGLVGLSIRVRGVLQTSLLQAAFDRKLKRQRPWTQQEIAAEAISLWLKKHGYSV